MTKNKRSILVVSLSVALLIGCWILWRVFGMEASFNLAPDSRLPRWFTIPPGLSRSDVSVTMNYYSSPFRDATFILNNARSKKKIAEVDGSIKGEPLKLRKPPPGYPPGYPVYEIITIAGITEVIEHRKMEPIFYVTDDAAVLSELGVSRRQ